MAWLTHGFLKYVWYTGSLLFYWLTDTVPGISLQERTIRRSQKKQFSITLDTIMLQKLSRRRSTLRSSWQIGIWHGRDLRARVHIRRSHLRGNPGGRRGRRILAHRLVGYTCHMTPSFDIPTPNFAEGPESELRSGFRARNGELKGPRVPGFLDWICEVKKTLCISLTIWHIHYTRSITNKVVFNHIEHNNAANETHYGAQSQQDHGRSEFDRCSYFTHDLM